MKPICEAGLTGYRILSYLEQHPDGSTPRELADAIGLSCGTISLALRQLANVGHIQKTPDENNKASYYAHLTASGNEAVQRCDEEMVRTYDEFFATLSGEERSNLMAGSLLTTAHFGLTRFDGANYLAQYSVLIGFLKNEQYFIKTTNVHNIAYGEYRVLLMLLENPDVGNSANMRHRLLVHQSELSNWIHSLEAKGMVELCENPLDKRGYIVHLTHSGKQKVLEINESIDVSDIRPSEDGETALYNKMFRAIMDELRRKK